MPPLMPAAKLRPVGPSTTTVPPVMYSQQWSPTPSTTVAAAELRTAKRSPARPRKKARPRVAPYSTVLPTITFCSATKLSSIPSRGRTARTPPECPRAAAQRAPTPRGEPPAEALPRRALEVDRYRALGQALGAARPRDVAREDAADAAVAVADRQLDLHARLDDRVGD